MNDPHATQPATSPLRGSREPLWWLLALLGAAAVARVALYWNVPLPACNFKRLTGVPCPFCGGTRALKSVAEFDLWAAVQFNPLVCLAGLAVVAWFALWVTDRFRTRPLRPRIRRLIDRWPVWWIAGGLVLVNWAYLIRTLP